jgi:SHS2 domain-containing protein
MSWELIDHTGDIGVEARAPTLEELFAECARAMFSVLAETGTPAPTGRESFQVAGADPAEELRDFLSELLYRFSAERRMYVAFVPEKGSLSAAWESYDQARHPLRTELKAVTYHQLEVVQDGDGWRGRVIFDV